MDRLQSGKTGDRSIADGLSSMGNGAAGLLLFGDSDSRRVIRELMPELPKPFQEVTGEWIADELEWAGLQLDVNETIEIRVESKQAAKLRQNSSGARPNRIGSAQTNAQTRELITESELDFFFDAILPKRSGSRVYGLFPKAFQKMSIVWQKFLCLKL